MQCEWDGMGIFNQIKIEMGMGIKPWEWEGKG